MLLHASLLPLNQKSGVVANKLIDRMFGVSPTALKAEDKDYEGDLKKLEAEAEERLDNKISELMANIEKAGQDS